MKNFTTTIGRLASQTGGSDREDYQKAIKAWRMLQEVVPTETENGRMSYGIVQQVICMASNGAFTYGGQGNKNPDFYYGELWGETKSFKRNQSTAHVAASAFQASNSSVPKHRELLQECPEKAKKFLFEKSYDKNDIYCLTGNGKVGDTILDLEEVELIICQKELLVECLLESTNFKEVDIELLRERVRELEC